MDWEAFSLQQHQHLNVEMGMGALKLSRHIWNMCIMVFVGLRQSLFY